MKSTVLANFDQIWLPVTGLLIFVTIFTLMLLYVFRKGSKSAYEEIESIPLREGKKK